MILALSLAAILLLTALAWALGFRNAPILDEGSARDEAEGRLAGFRAATVALADDGRGALLRGLDGSLAIILPLGDGWLARRLPAGSRVNARPGAIEIPLAEPLLRQAVLPFATPPAWLDEGRA